MRLIDPITHTTHWVFESRQYAIPIGHPAFGIWRADSDCRRALCYQSDPVRFWTFAMWERWPTWVRRTCCAEAAAYWQVLGYQSASAGNQFDGQFAASNWAQLGGIAAIVGNQLAKARAKARAKQTPRRGRRHARK